MTKSHLNLFVKDDNKYVILAIRFLIRSALSDVYTVTFLPQKKWYSADLMIVSWKYLYYLSKARTNNNVLLIVGRGWVSASPSLPDMFVLNRYDPVSGILMKIKRAFEQTPDMHRYYIPKLTRRERQVLSSIERGLSNIQIAELLSIHTKTVSCHTRNAMRKLSFRRKHDLYHWLRFCGLGQMMIF